MFLSLSMCMYLCVFGVQEQEAGAVGGKGYIGGKGRTSIKGQLSWIPIYLKSPYVFHLSTSLKTPFLSGLDDCNASTNHLKALIKT